MIREAILQVVSGKDLSEAEMEQVMARILAGEVTSSQVGAFITALRMKGETVAEITAAARTLRRLINPLSTTNHLLTIDRDDIHVEGETILATTAGGQDGTNTFNISTATAFVVAGGGVKVARFGHRSGSKQFGAADVLEALGINIDLSDSDLARCLEETGIGFMFSPLSQGPMKYVADFRKEIGVRSIFNLIGPLANPAKASSHLLGVYDPALTQKMAEVLQNLGAERALVVHGEVTNDEISICGLTRIARLQAGEINTETITPETFGMSVVAPGAIRGGDAQTNARIIEQVLGGQTGPARDIVELNAAAAFVAGGADASIADGIARARSAIDSGAAKDKLAAVIDVTRRSRSFVRKEL